MPTNARASVRVLVRAVRGHSLSHSYPREPLPAEYQGVTTYQDLAVIMGLPLQGAHMGKETGHVLGEISEDEVKAGRPMLSAVAVSVVSGKAGPGFFTLAKELGRFGGEPADEENFWRQELKAVYDTWKRALHKPSKDT